MVNSRFKFRAWEKTSKEMVYDVQNVSRKRIIGESACESFQEVIESWEYEIMQFTGLYDKNGKEIYEGDIVRVVKPGEYIPNRDDGGGIIDYDYRKPEERICIVEYFGATYATKEVKNEKYYAPLDWIIEDENIEVIGNIYEHKRLLEVDS